MIDNKDSLLDDYFSKARNESVAIPISHIRKLISQNPPVSGKGKNGYSDLRYFLISTIIVGVLGYGAYMLFQPRNTFGKSELLADDSKVLASSTALASDNLQDAYSPSPEASSSEVLEAKGGMSNRPEQQSGGTVSIEKDTSLEGNEAQKKSATGIHPRQMEAHAEDWNHRDNFLSVAENVLEAVGEILDEIQNADDSNDFTNLEFVEIDSSASLNGVFRVNGPGQLEAETSGGNIKIVGGDADKVIVHGILRKNGRTIDENSDEYLHVVSSFNLNISQIGNKVFAIAKKDWRSSPLRHYSVSFVIQVPTKMACNATTSGGNVELSMVEGLQNLQTSGGDISIGYVQGNVSANTSGGNIHANTIEGAAVLKTSGGNIHMESSKGNVKANTSGGNVRLINISGEIDAHTSGGNVHVSGSASGVSATTSGGEIEVDLIELSDFLYLETSGGGVHATIPATIAANVELNGSHVSMDLSNFDGEAKKDKVVGAINGGGMPITMKTSGGGVSLNFK